MFFSPGYGLPLWVAQAYLITCLCHELLKFLVESRALPFSALFYRSCLVLCLTFTGLQFTAGQNRRSYWTVTMQICRAAIPCSDYVIQCVFICLFALLRIFSYCAFVYYLEPMGFSFHLEYGTAILI